MWLLEWIDNFQTHIYDKYLCILCKFALSWMQQNLNDD